MNYPRPAVTVDLVVLTVLDADLKVLLVRRAKEPFAGRWALPGGFVRVGPEGGGESLEEAATRVLDGETGLPSGSSFLAQLAAFGDPDRDPRMRVISIAWYALVRSDLAALVRAGEREAEVGWFSVGAELPGLGGLAFDHDAIVAAAVARVRAEIDDTRIAFRLVPPTFSIAELRGVHEAVKGAAYDAGNFRRRFQRMLTDGLIEEAPGKRHTARRPAAVYRFVG
jgi:8-oxo-dGTP diphosphatase